MLGLASAAEFRFAFGPDETRLEYSFVTPQTLYDAKRGYGYLRVDAGAPDKPSVFAVDVDEGNYDVTIKFGDPARATSTTIKTESRRLMVEKVDAAPAQYETRTFTVNVRKPAISSGGVTKLNSRELGPPVAPDWDDHLSFEFNGAHPGVAAIEIKPAPDAVTLFIAGDSTVTDQPREPYAGWGQMLPRFFKQGVAVSNHAESGLALASFEGQKRLEKVLSMMKSGDYLFIQFGHNDQKDKRPNAGAFTTYTADLKRYVEAVRKKNGIPVLVTPMERRRFDTNGKPTPTLADYAQAVKQVGAAAHVPVIDLNAMSLILYTALGPENSTKAFVFYPANTFPGKSEALKDNTHHNAYGGYELARCIVEGIRGQVPELAKHLAQDAGTFDPIKPDPPENFTLPASPINDKVEKPAGN